MAVELLSPAGSLKSMRYAFAYGADAVYAGQPRYSLRVRNNEFNKMEVMASAIEEAHNLGKKFFLASNVSPHNDKVRSYIRDLEPVVAMNPDALIMADPGLIMLVREKWPDLPVHLSVQANAVNWASVKFWEKQGIERVILSRELSLDEIEDIRQHCPDIELEVFVHGALCIAYSGRCLLSGYMTHRDPNQGACTNACRWKYNAQEAEQNETGDIIAKEAPASNPGVGTFDPSESEALFDQAAGFNKASDTTDKMFLLEEQSRPGEFMPAFEDEHGTYIMNSKDLRAVQHVQRLIDMGIDCLKIEGRTKSHYYVGRTAQVYRRAIDEALAGKEFDMNMMAELDHLANRGYTEGFYRRHVPSEYQNYEQGTSTNPNQQFVAEVAHADSDWLTLDVKNRFEVGDSLELITPQGNRNITLQHLENKNGEKVDAAPGSGHVVRIPTEGIQLPEDGGYAMVMRHL